MLDYRLKYLQSLYKSFNQDKSEVIKEIINLEAILNLPKGTEHFLSDIHGEFDSFDYVLRTGSGSIRTKLDEYFDQKLDKAGKNQLATLIYYPEEVSQLIINSYTDRNKLDIWYIQTIRHLICLIKYTSSKYTRSKLRKALPSNFAYIIEELLYRRNESPQDTEAYYHAIFYKIIELDQAQALIIVLCHLIQRLVVDHLHVVGDIFDRGPAPHKIIERLMAHHSVDIQWGNHDLLWLGAMAGSKANLCNVVRICARYNNLDILEDTYGINLRPLIEFAKKNYNENPKFLPKDNKDKAHTSPEELDLLSRVHQAITIIQFKIEAAIIYRRPEFNLQHRLLLDKINYQEMTIDIDGISYPLSHTCFTTVHSDHPYQLTPEEEHVVNHLLASFQHSVLLKKHLDFLVQKGSLYLCYNGNLLIHGCVPVTQDGEFAKLSLGNQVYSGRNLLDHFELMVRQAYQNPDITDDLATDTLWYLWCGEHSSLFGKTKMTTFERYFIADANAHYEPKNPYYSLREQKDFIEKILMDFDLNSHEGIVINGHTPVIEKKGEDPIKADGKLFVIDGGFAKAYQDRTGIAGYSLISNSYGLVLVTHHPFTSKEEVISHQQTISDSKRVVPYIEKRRRVKNTNIGSKLEEDLKDLHDILNLIN